GALVAKGLALTAFREEGIEMLGEGFEGTGGRGNGQAEGQGTHLLPARSHSRALPSTNYR
ncbi:MAG: hypothetical protein M3Y58_11795, partial [Chloroflexota bacterium]|nr:hypothetical protein [Chloroflexota bacterium]